MSEFKYACPVCGQHMKCDSSQSGTVMECPTCFQKITAPQAPETDDPKFIITGTRVGERPIPVAVADSGSAPTPAPQKKSYLPVIIFIVFLCAAAVALFAFRGSIFKPAGGPANQGTSKQTPPRPPPKPIVGLVSVVFAKGNSIVLGAETNEVEVKDPAQASFLAGVKADLPHPLAFEGPVELTTLSGNGPQVRGAAGEIQYHGSFHGGLVIGVTLEGAPPQSQIHPHTQRRSQSRGE